MNPIFRFKKEEGKIIPRYDPNTFNVGGTHIQYLPDGDYEAIVKKEKKGRSINQNRYYFGVVLKLLSEHTGHRVEELHEACKSMFNPTRIEFNTKKGIEAVRASRSTTSLTTIKMEEYLTDIRRWASEYLGIFIPLPNEVDY